MQLKTIFKAQSIIFLINGLGQLFSTAMFFEMANMEVTPHLLAVGQFMGVTFIFFSVLTWKTPELAGSSVNSFGSLWALGCLFWTAIISYHIAIDVVGGPTALVNVGLFAVFSVLYFITSKK